MMLWVISRFSTVQQRAICHHAVWDGDQILQRPCTPLPHEEGPLATLEDSIGELLFAGTQVVGAGKVGDFLVSSTADWQYLGKLITSMLNMF